MGFFDTLRHGWDVFRNREPTYYNGGHSSSYRPDRTRLSGGNEKTIVTSIFNRIAIDVSSIDIRHCRIDANGRFVENIDSGMNNCLSLEANKDQTGRAFLQDTVMSMLDEGAVAIVPVDTTFDPVKTNSYDILTMRTGKILEWSPDYVKIRIYNDRTGQQEDIAVSKSTVGIVENPLYAVINEKNSTMARLLRKLALLDAVDEITGSGKLDMVIQLPYMVRSEARKKEATKRIQSIEEQLKGPYGIAYVDGTEKIIQLNRPIENNLMKQIEYLQNLLYSQLGITQEVMNGTADEKTMLNYNNRTVEPILSAIVDEMKRKFLTKTARTQLQTIMFFRDPFKLVPVNDIAEIADKFTRNEIMTSNEIRQLIGMKPSDDPKADKLVNSNLNQPDSIMQDIQVDSQEENSEALTSEDEEDEENEDDNYEFSLGNMPVSSLANLDE